MIFYVKYEHDEQFWTDGLLQILKGWKRKAAGLRRQFWELAGAPRYKGHTKRYRTQWPGIWPWLSVRTTGAPLATDNKGSCYRPFW